MTTQGDRLKQIRQTLRLSQEEFGKELNVSKQYVSNLESNRNFLNNEKLIHLLIDFDVNINFLLGGVGNMFIQKPFEQVEDELEQKVVEVMKKYGVIEK